MPLNHCIEVFAQGLAFTRTMARPYLCSNIGGVGWWLRDAPEYMRPRRNDEWIVDGSLQPRTIDRQARKRAAGGFLVNVVSTSAVEKEFLCAGYKGFGYRLWRTEWLMRRATANDARTIDARVTIALVDNEELVSRLAVLARGRLVLPMHLGQTPMPVRCHVALVDRQIVGWARSVTVAQSSWLASLFVQPALRRRGIGTALVAATLHADEAAGLSDSVLVASHAGAELYAKARYEAAGEVLVFTPPR